MSLKLFTDDRNPQAWKAQVTAAFTGVKLEVVHAEHTPWGKVPALQTSEGVLTEPNAIARFLARQERNNLYGDSSFHTALIDNWIEWAVGDVELPGSVWTLPILGIVPNHPAATTKAKADIRKALETLNKHLLTTTFLVGDRLSLADIVVAAGLWRLYTLVLDNGFRKSFQNTNRWFTTVVNQPQFLNVVGETKLVDKMQIAKETEPKEEKVKEEKPKKEEKKKEEKPKKEEKKEEKKKENEEEVDDDDVAAAEERESKKKPNPLDLLPPSKFNLEEWKRVYSNEDTRQAAMPWFWEHFDSEGYSVWFADYKDNNLLEKVFMTCNLVGGFIQRMDAARKYSFASICIFGEDGKMEISGCFVFRGQEIPPIAITECPDIDSYIWRKANINETATKELIADFFAWGGSFGGKTLGFNQAKSLK